MAAFLQYTLRFIGVSGLLGLISCIPGSNAADISPYADSQKLSPLDLQPLEYSLDVPGRGQIVTSTMTFTEFLDSEGFDYGAVVYLPTHEMDNHFEPIHHDLNGDDFEDVLVPLMVLPQDEQNAADDGGFLALATVLNQQGQPVHVDTVFLGMIYEVQHVDDQIVVQGSAEQWGDEATFTYRWTAAGLDEISRVSLNLDDVPFSDQREQYRDNDLENSRFINVGAVDDPLVLTQSIFGYTPEPNEETGRETTVQVLERSNHRIVVGVTQKRLEDDSVAARRYRLEFVPDGQLWRFDWMGQQLSCQSGRGRQMWHKDLCA